MSNQKGFVASYFAILILLAVFAVANAVAVLTQGQQKILRNVVKSSQAYYLAEAGVEDAVYRIKNSKQYPASYNLIINGIATTVNVSGANTKTIISQSNLNNVFRTVKAVLTVTSVNPQFYYGAQAGDGGIVMEENSRIEGVGGQAGNLYSNGPIGGASGATITGDAVVAVGSLDNIAVYGNVRANAITNGKICGNAYYQSASSIDAGSKNFLDNPSNPACPNPLTPGTGYPNQPSPPLLPMPISQTNIDQWKTDAESGGVISGDYNVISNVNLGPRKITGNLIMTSNNKILTATGAIYVQGNIDIDNGSTIKCASSYGTNSCVVLADGWISIKNNSQFQGSGFSGSYVMILTTLPGCNGGAQQSDCAHHNAAVDLHNNASGAIFYAANSMIYLHNGVNVSEITAYKIKLENNAVVAYEQGLTNAQFSSGPGGSWKILNWEEVE